MHWSGITFGNLCSIFSINDGCIRSIRLVSMMELVNLPKLISNLRIPRKLIQRKINKPTIKFKSNELSNCVLLDTILISINI